MTMPRVRIVTDSAARFPTTDFAAREPITVAPLTIRCAGLSLEDDPNIDVDRLRALFEDGDPPPVAEPPSVELMTSIYERLQKETDQILSIHTSACLTGTVANARAASQQFLGRCNIQVIDSQTISFGLGLLVQAGIEAAARDEDFDDIIRVVRGMIPRLYTVFFLDDMVYLERNKLISRSQSVLGNMLGVIPFLTMEDGKIVPMEKVRSRSRALEKLVEFVSEFSTVDSLALLQGRSEPTEETALIAERLQAIHPHTPIILGSYSPSLATFIGPDSLGVVVLEAEEEVP